MKCSILLTFFLICELHFSYGVSTDESLDKSSDQGPTTEAGQDPTIDRSTETSTKRSTKPDANRATTPSPPGGSASVCESIDKLQVKAAYSDQKYIDLFLTDGGASYGVTINKELDRKAIHRIDLDAPPVAGASIGRFQELKASPEAAFFFYSGCAKDYGYLIEDKQEPVQYVTGKILMWPTDEMKSPFEAADGKAVIDKGASIKSVALLRAVKQSVTATTTSSAEPPGESTEKSNVTNENESDESKGSAAGRQGGEEDEGGYGIYKVTFTAGPSKGEDETGGGAKRRKNKGASGRVFQNGQTVKYLKMSPNKVEDVSSTILAPAGGDAAPTGRQAAEGAVEEAALFQFLTENPKEGSITIGYQFKGQLAYPVYYSWSGEKVTEHAMLGEDGKFNPALDAFKDKFTKSWYKHVVPLASWLNCPVEVHCLGRPPDAVVKVEDKYRIFWRNHYYQVDDTKTALWDPKTGAKDKIAPKELSAEIGEKRIDVAFASGDKMFLIKETTVYVKSPTECAKLENFDSSKLGLPSGATDKIEAAVTHAESVYIFADSKVYNVPAATVASVAGEKGAECGEAKQTPPEPPTASSEAPSKESSEAPPESSSESTAADDKTEPPASGGGSRGATEEDDATDPSVAGEQKKKRKKSRGGLRRSRREEPESKEYTEVNEAYLSSIDLVFLSDDKIVTMVNHFVAEQSVDKFFKEKENAEFKLHGESGTAYFGCDQAKFKELKWTPEFVTEYVKFAKPTKELPPPTTTAETTTSDGNSTSSESKTTAKKATTGDDESSSGLRPPISFLTSFAMVAYLFMSSY